jgi:hypothetical protein
MLLLNQLQATSVRLVTPETGVWFADVDVTLDETGIVPSGPCVLTIGLNALLGTIDPNASGAFAKSGKIRVLGGGGGWGKAVLPLHIFPAPLSTTVYSVTAAEVGEVVVDALPVPLPEGQVRCAGPASAVFGSSAWYVTLQGVTMVGPRLPLPYDPTSVDILTFDPLTRTLELASDDPIAPGTILLDPLRFDGPLIVRDVEQTWTAGGGARATAWCADSAGSRLQKGLAALVAGKAGLPFLKTYRYRVVLQGPAQSDVVLQAIDLLGDAPNAVPFPLWFGVPGIAAQLMPGSEVLVSFTADTPPRAFVHSFKGGVEALPLLLEIGLATSPIALATGTQAQISLIVTALGAIGAYIATLTSAAAAAPLFPAFALGMATPGATVATALGGVSAAVAAASVAATSIRVVSD